MDVEDLMTQPMPDFAAARRAMIDSQLRPQGVTDPAVLAAMAAVAREEFVPESVRPLAYGDRPIDLGGGQALMPPAALARLLAELQPRPGERALVVGGGNGYAPAVLQAMGLAVDTANGQSGAGQGVYDIVLLDGAVEEIPNVIVGRLAPRGRLGCAIADNGVTRLAIGLMAGGALGLRRFADVHVPLLPGFARPRVFTF
jgi:protein-L-isoaspartate(D-aspartate) O-methyltransferase